jgi:polysaccharide pyruvyl transferase WcaK-like protein
MGARSTDGSGGITSANVHLINRVGHGLIIGGGNFLENGRLTIDLQALAALQVPVIMLGVSYGFVINRQGQNRMRTDALPATTIQMLCAKMDQVLVRDHATQHHLNSFGVKNVSVGGCPSLFLDCPPKSGETRSGKNALVSIRAPETMNLPPQRMADIEIQIRHIIKTLKTKGYNRVSLLCHDIQDIVTAQRMGIDNHIFTSSFQQFMSLIQNADLLATYRLHSFLPAIVCKTPAIYLTCDERTQSMAETIGAGPWAIDINREADVFAAFDDRLAKLEQFETTALTSIEKSRNTLSQTMLEAMSQFKISVSKFKESFKLTDTSQ